MPKVEKGTNFAKRVSRQSRTAVGRAAREQMTKTSVAAHSRDAGIVAGVRARNARAAAKHRDLSRQAALLNARAQRIFREVDSSYIIAKSDRTKFIDLTLSIGGSRASNRLRIASEDVKSKSAFTQSIMKELADAVKFAEKLQRDARAGKLKKRSRR